MSLYSDKLQSTIQVLEAQVEANQATIAELVEALDSCIEYFEPMADADQPNGSHPIANREMRLMIDAEIAIRDAKRLMP